MSEKDQMILQIKKSDNYIVISIVGDTVFRSVHITDVNKQEFIDELGEIQAEIKRTKQ